MYGSTGMGNSNSYYLRADENRKLTRLVSLPYSYYTMSTSYMHGTYRNVYTYLNETNNNVISERIKNLTIFNVAADIHGTVLYMKTGPR